MKMILTVTLLLVTTLWGYAQGQSLQQNNQWLEKNLNALAQKEGSGNPYFRFNDCDAKMEIKVKEESGFNMGMNLGCELNEIEKVSYKKQGSNYQLNLHMKSEQADKGNFNFSLDTTDEKLMQEIKRRLEASIEACKSTQKS